MSVYQSRYAETREKYFAVNGKPPPVPPKQGNEYTTSGEKRHFSPTSSPHRSWPSPTHYSQYSHSVPRNRSKTKYEPSGPGRSSAKPSDRSVARSTSFTHPTPHPAPHETPPTIPPRPVTTSIVEKTFKRAQPKFLTGDLSFEDLIKHYQKSFPLRVYVTNGYLGATSRLTISTGDMYNIHFLKKTRVMVFKDTHDTPYSIPLNSAIEFGLLYQPKQGRKPAEIETGVMFSSVSDLLSQPEVPRVVAVLKSWQSGDGKTSVVTNEVLFVKSTQRSMFGKKGVKVFSLTTKSDKFLSDECSTQFSTQPSLCRLHITDIVDHVKQPKGEKCVLFLNSQVLVNREMSTSLQAIPDELFAKVLTIVDQVTETSLIASSMLHRRLGVSDEDYDPDRDVLFDIPVDENTAEMTCSVVDIPDSSDNDRLYDDTKSLYEKFDPTKVMTIKDTGSEGSHQAQKLLYTTIRLGCEGLGVELSRPEALYEVIPATSKTVLPPTAPLTPPHMAHPPPPPAPPIPQAPPVSPAPNFSRPPLADPAHLTGSTYQTDSTHQTDSAEQDDRESDEYDEVTQETLELAHRGQMPNLQTASVSRVPRLQAWPDRQEGQEGNLEKTVRELQQQLGEVAGLRSKLEQNVDRVGQLEREIAKLRAIVDKLVPQIYGLQSKLVHITSPQRQVRGPAENGRQGEGEGGHAKNEDEILEQNKTFLRSLSSQEVCDLLVAMEMGQYKEAFIKESVSGEILADCDDDILQSDLGVASRLHRLRLMKVVSGRHSAANLMEGADPYVMLGKK